MKWEHLEKFLELIYIQNMEFKKLHKKSLYNNFRNNEYYIIKSFCEINNFIIIEYNQVELTSKGIEFFMFLKKMRLIYK